MTTPQETPTPPPTPTPSDERNGCFLDSMWCCKVCDGEIPDGHTDWCDIWKLEKKHRDFLTNEYNSALERTDKAERSLARVEADLAETVELLEASKRRHYYCEDSWYSCPKAEDGCANPAEGTECNCSADFINGKIDALLSRLREGKP